MTPIGLALHDRVRIVLEDASRRDVQTVMNATGASPTDVLEPTDIEVRFADNTHGIDVHLPDDCCEQPFRMTVPTGQRRLPLLRSMVNVKMVYADLLPLHASAWTCPSGGMLACGWSGGGKTGMLLAHLLHGAEYLAAEWAYVCPASSRIYGVPETLRLRSWHLRQGAGGVVNVRRQDQWRLWKTRLMAGVLRRSADWLPQPQRLRRTLTKAAAGAQRRCYIDKPASSWLATPSGSRSAPLQTVYFAGVHDSSAIDVKPVELDAAHARLVALQDEDLTDLDAQYRRWSYDHPRADAWRECWNRKRDRLIRQMLVGKQLYAVDRPVTVGLTDLYRTLNSTMRTPCLQSL